MPHPWVCLLENPLASDFASHVSSELLCQLLLVWSVLGDPPRRDTAPVRGQKMINITLVVNYLTPVTSDAPA